MSGNTPFRRFNYGLVLLVLSLVLSVPGFSETDDARKGREAHERLSEYTHFSTNEKVNAYVNEIGQKLVKHSDWPDYDFHFFVVDSPGINAFAADGGYIYINRGLLSYITSEAQLAAVLAHEIAHVTRRHLNRQRDQQTLGNIAAFVLSIMLWNGNVGEAIRLENAARVSGYGREMELEADEYGATYLYNAGYDPEAIIEVLGILKDNQTFSTRQVRDQGREPITYHGVFSTHPRNDQRLRDVIEQAGTLPPGEAFVGRAEYREVIDGMVFGPNDTTTAPPGYTRYSSRGLGVTFAYPENWERSTEGQNIHLTSDTGIKMMLKVTKPTDVKPSAEEFLLSHHQVEKLNEQEPIFSENIASQEEALMAFSVIEGSEKRVAAVKLGAYVYLFESIAPTPLSEEADEEIVNVIRTFRRAENTDYPPDDIKNVYFRRLKPGETFAELAQDRVLGRYTEDYLRQINGYYPNGEPQPGTWIKMVE